MSRDNWEFIEFSISTLIILHFKMCFMAIEIFNAQLS